MKKIIYIFFGCLLCTMTVTAQDSLYIYKTGGPIEAKLISTIDSIIFSSKQDSMYIHHSGTLVASYLTSVVDSISFTHTKIAQSTTIDIGVVINGVHWATRNVNTPGTFVSAPAIYGYFYQWNSNVGWPSTGAMGSITATDGSTTWNTTWAGGYTTPSTSDTWTTANDPSPKGWRVPTYAEIQTLLDTTKVTGTWTTQNGVYGEKFTDKTTTKSVFLSTSGFRDDYEGMVANAGLCGYFWSSTADSSITSFANNLCIIGLSGWDDYSSYSRALFFPVRPVAK
ncbi:MAG: FISUMP domain-containing protein [Paludibacteraceae bacterium]|nr:FISUMP domain-containing protein [Paludibacteraceae bacterium]